MKRNKTILLLVLTIVAIVSLVACQTIHTHTYGDTWTNDGTQHWHAATCEHTTEKKDAADHVDTGKDGICDICGGEIAHDHIDADQDGLCDVCSEEVAHDHVDEDEDKKCDICEKALYTVEFKNGDTVVSSTTVVSGAKVAIPEAPAQTDARYTFNGWQGVSEAEMTAGEIEVFNADQTFSAKWAERFGTEKEISITEIRSLADVTVDGVKDAAYNDATAIEIASEKTDATATAYVMWSKEYFYVFVDVKDSTVNDNDFVELRLELLHTDKYAAGDWDGSWGGHRKDASSEGGWKVKSGATSTEYYWEYWSHLNDERKSAQGVSVRNDNGYTVEWVIKVEKNGFDSVEEDLVPHAGQQIGMGILINNEGNGWAGIENFDGYNSNVKRLTNTNLVANENNNPNALIATVNGTRAYWDAEDQATRDRMFTGGRFTDFSTVEVGESSLKVLWSSSKMYIRPVPGANTKSLVLTKGETNYTVDLANPQEIAIAGEYVEKGFFDFTLKYKDGDAEEVTKDCTFKLAANPWNRNKYTISKLDGTITVDGEKDAAYDDAAIDVGVKSEGNPSATGKAYFKWSDEYLYVLVEVTDSDVTPADSQKGPEYNNDSVEVWISTCRVLPNEGWGNIRPNGDYCGEGGFRVQTNNNTSGQHWMWDWRDGVPRETAVKFTDAGYTVEYKIHLSAFADVTDKVGQYIDIMVNINDDNGNDGAREGVVSMNTSGSAAWDQPWALDRFELVA